MAAWLGKQMEDLSLEELAVAARRVAEMRHFWEVRRSVATTGKRALLSPQVSTAFQELETAVSEEQSRRGIAPPIQGETRL